MGTRNLTMVVRKGEVKVAQYGQWDGYPDGQGKTILEFMRDKYDAEKFAAALDNTRFLTKEEIENWGSKDIPEQISRDIGGGVLPWLQEHGGGVLKDSSSFAADSLFCEWGWVVDLDAGVLEVYRGFNKRKPVGRFEGVQGSEEGYEAITLIRTFDLSALPSTEEFLDAFVEEEGDES